MDHVSVLSVLTCFEKGSDNDKIIEESVNKALNLLSENNKESIKNLWKDWCEDGNIRWRYILLIIFVIEEMKKTSLNDKDDTFSVKELQTLKIAMEIITLEGIKANCILYSKPRDDKRDMAQKFERLAYVAKFCSTCFDDFLLKTCVLIHIGPILTSLMFIANAVFAPPKADQTSDTTQDSAMTQKMYENLINIQKEFKMILPQTISKCPVTLLMKEFMVIHGTSTYPKFIRVPAKKYLVDCIVQPNGVLSLLLVMCNEEEFSNISRHWDKLEIASRLLASSCGTDKDQYYDSVCAQLIELLKAQKFTQSTTIVNACIKSLFEFNVNICIDKFLKVIAAPFFCTETKSEVENKLWNEQEVSESIEMLSKCFLTDEPEFKQLPTEMLTPITLPIFHLYVRSLSSISSYRLNIKQLALKMLSSRDNQEELFCLFLNYNQKFTENYGVRLYYQLGDSGNFEIVKKGDEIDHEEFCNALFELIKEDNVMAFKLFNFLLKRLANFETDPGNRLETSWDIVDRITKHLSSVNLLVQLANLSIVQKNNLEKPENLLSFVKSLLTKQLDSNKTSQDDEMDVGYIGLMLVKQILEESQDCKNWTPFEQLVSFLEGRNVSSSAKKLVDEIVHVVKVKKKSTSKNYEDLSSSKEKSEFEKAREDLADPLLPVRAHGLVALTKLIEKGDCETLEKKDFLVCIFQLNLKHDDSFIYLAAINGLCALTLRYPQSVIEILIQEFIDMPQRVVQHDLSPENRAKIGEILVKATRSLGEMASVHRTALINGFLCAVRDADSMVRASSLSCLGELCKILGFRLGSVVDEVIYCIYCIIKHDKQPECRRAAVLVITLLLRGLGKHVLVGLDPKHLLETYRYLKYLRDNDNDDVIRLHVQLALEEIDDIVTNQLLAKPKLEKTIFLIPD